MFIHLFLLISVSLVFGTPTSYESVPLRADLNVDVYGIKEDSVELLKQLYRKLKAAYIKGSDYLQKVLEDEDVKGILDHLGPLTGKIAARIIAEFIELAQKIDEATKDYEDTYAIGDRSKELVKKFLRILRDAYNKGTAELERVLNDPDVKAILEHLDGIQRRIVESIIEKMRELAKKIDEAIDEKETETAQYSMGHDAVNNLKKLVQLMKNAMLKGLDELNRVLNDEDVKELLRHMNNITRRIAETLIEKFRELAKKIDEIATKNNEPESLKRDLTGDSWELLKSLTSILTKAFNKGKEYFYKVLEDPDVQAILDHLGPLTRRIAEATISKFKDLLEKIDEATNSKETVEAQYGLFDDSKEYLKQLVRILKAAYEKGSEYLDKVLEDPDVKAILDHLGPLTRKVAEGIIEKFKELAHKIDEATKE